MTFLLNLLIGVSSMLIVAAIENISMACTWKWVLQGAQGKPACSD